MVQGAAARTCARDDLIRRRPRETLAPTRVMLYGDAPAMRRLVANILRNDGYIVSEINNARDLERRARLKWLNADLIVLATRKPGHAEMDALATLRTRDWMTPVVILTALGASPMLAEGRGMDTTMMLSDPFNADEVRYAVRSVAPPLI